MGSTGACTIEVVTLATSTPLEPDYAAEVTYAELALVISDGTEPVGDDDYVDIDPRGTDAFAV